MKSIFFALVFAFIGCSFANTDAPVQADDAAQVAQPADDNSEAK